MKGLSYSFLRAICALVIGLVLVMFPDQAGDLRGEKRCVSKFGRSENI